MEVNMNWKKLLIIAVAVVGFGFVSAPRAEAGLNVGSVSASLSATGMDTVTDIHTDMGMPDRLLIAPTGTIITGRATVIVGRRSAAVIGTAIMADAIIARGCTAAGKTARVS